MFGVRAQCVGTLARLEARYTTSSGPAAKPRPGLQLAPLANALQASGNAPFDSYNDETVAQLVQKDLDCWSLDDMCKFGRNITAKRLVVSAQYLQRQIPIRLSHQAYNYERLPYLAFSNVNIRRVHDKIHRSLKVFNSFGQINTPEDEKRFNDLLQTEVENHRDVIDLLAKGFKEVKPRIEHIVDINKFLDDNLRSRIGLRLLCEQHLALHNPPSDNQVGIILTKLKIADVVKHCIRICTNMCEQTYGACAPDVYIEGHTDATVMYIPAHVEYVVTELLKNSMRATIEFDRKNREVVFPAITITIAKTDKSVALVVRDKGGGVPSDLLPNIFNYSFTTVESPENASNLFSAITARAGDSPMAGLGFGLPLARLFASHYGGGVDFHSIEGYGSDVYVRLNLSNSRENLQPAECRK